MIDFDTYIMGNIVDGVWKYLSSKKSYKADIPLLREQ